MKKLLIVLFMLGISGCATNKDIVNLQTQIDRLTIKTAMLKTDIESLDSSVELLKTYISNLNNQVFELNTRVSDMDKKLNRVFTKSTMK